jgi:hypothetical protein
MRIPAGDIVASPNCGIGNTAEEKEFLSKGVL